MVPTLTVCIAMFAYSVASLGPSKTEEQTADGSPDFDYFSLEAKATAQELETKIPNVREALGKHVDELQTALSKATKALQRYKDILESVEGSHCVGNKDVDVNGIEKNIEAIIRTCAAAAPTVEVDVLRDKIKEAVAKVQAIDNTLRLNAKLCSSEAPSESCKETKANALKELKDITSHGEMAKINYDFRAAFFKPKSSIDTCVEEETKALQEQLNAGTKGILDCKTSQ